MKVPIKVTFLLRYNFESDYWINQGNALENKAKNVFGVKKKKIPILPTTLMLIPSYNFEESFVKSPANPEKSLQKTENIVTIE